MKAIRKIDGVRRKQQKIKHETKGKSERDGREMRQVSSFE